MPRQTNNPYSLEHLDNCLTRLETRTSPEDISSVLASIEYDFMVLKGVYNLNNQIERFVKAAETRKECVNLYLMQNKDGELLKLLMPYPHLFDVNVKILVCLHEESKATDLDRCHLLEECIEYMSSIQKILEISKSVISLILSVRNTYSVVKIAEKSSKTFNQLLRQAALTSSAKKFYQIFSYDAEFLDIDVKCTYYRLKHYNYDPDSLMELLNSCLTHLENSQNSLEIMQVLTTLFDLFKEKSIDSRLAQRKFIQIAKSQQVCINQFLLQVHSPEAYNILKTIPDLLDIQVTEKYFEDIADDLQFWDTLSTNLLCLSTATTQAEKKGLLNDIEATSEILRDKNQATLMEFAETHKISINEIHRQNIERLRLGGILTYYPTIIEDDLLIDYLKFQMPAPTESNIIYMLTVCLQKLKTGNEWKQINILLPAIDRLLDVYKFEESRLTPCIEELVEYAKNNVATLNNCLQSRHEFKEDGLLAILAPQGGLIMFDNKTKYIHTILKKMPRDLKWRFLLETLENIGDTRTAEALENVVFNIKRSLFLITNEGCHEFAETHKILINKILYQLVKSVRNNAIFELIQPYHDLWGVEIKIKFAEELLKYFDEYTKWELLEKCLKDIDTTIHEEYFSNCISAIVVNLFHKRFSNVFYHEKLIHFIENHSKYITKAIQISDISPNLLPLVVKHTKLVTFEDKMDYLHGQVKHPHEVSYNIDIDRNDIVISSFQQTASFTDWQWKQKFLIKFDGEDGVDCGGISREWFTILTREMFNPNYVLFTTAPGDPNSYMINKASHVNPEHLDYFKFFGKIIAKSIIENQRVHCNFIKSFYKQILNIPVECSDLESQDPIFFKSMYFMLKHPTEQLNMDLKFSTEIEEFGETIVKDLVDNGRNIAVTDENKELYVKLICELKMTESIKNQLEAFREGFHSIIPQNVLSIFTPDELEILIAGQPNIDVNNLEANTEYKGYEPTDEHILWFWRALKSFNVVERSKFLMFTTGSPNAPLHGFGALLGSNEVQKFTISKDDRGNRLPTANTCINRLTLPQYDSYSSMRAALLTAIEEGTEGFYDV